MGLTLLASVIRGVIRGVVSPVIGSDAPGFDPASMFTPTTPGWVYDLSDFSTLFQDSAGTTPVTAVEQPVGLVLDKSQGLVLGPELVTNGDFSQGTTGWTASTDGSISVSAGELTVVSSGIEGYGGQSFSTVVGRSYKLVVGKAVLNTGSLRIRIGASLGAFSQVNHITAGTNITYVFVASGATTWVSVGSMGAGASSTFDNISVKELPGNHASQPTTTKRPVLSSRVNLLTYSEDQTNAVWARGPYNSIALSPSKVAATATTAIHGFTQGIPSWTSQQRVISIVASAAEYSFLHVAFGSIAPPDGVSHSGTFDLTLGTVVKVGLWGSSATITALPDGKFLCVWVGGASTMSGGGNVSISFSPTAASNNYLGDGVSGVNIHSVQFETGSTATKYQWITTATNYDTAGFPLYLKRDGVDDFESTAAVDFTGADSVTIWQGVQKLSDTESGVLCELGAESITLNGTFGLFAPEPSGTGYMFNSRGTSRAFVFSPSHPAPHKCVLTAQGRISTDTCAIQINEGVVMTNAADQGINAYTLNPMYFGARGGTSNFFGGQQYSSVGIGKPGVTPEELYNTRTWVNDRTGAY